MKSVRILLLEDDDSLRDILSDLLLDHGYEVVAASTGEQAVKSAHQQEFDLVVTDIRMHGLDGLEALELVQRQQPGVPSMVVTGYSSESDSIRAIRLGVGDYLKKPFSTEAFLAAVQRLVAQGQKETELMTREEAIAQTIVWALESATSSLLLARPESAGQLSPESARQAAHAAENACLPPEAARHVQLAVLLGQLEPHEAEQLPSFLKRAVPTEVHSLLEEARQGEAGLSGQLVRAFLMPDQPLEPSLEEAVTAARAGRARRTQQPGPARSRSLLSLARALEESRDFASAADAYARVSETDQLSPELVEARMGLTRVFLQSGRAEEAARSLRAAATSAQALGPQAAAWNALEVGVLLAERDRSEALRQLATSAGLFQKLALPEGTAHALLLQHALQEAAAPEQLGALLGQVLRPELVGTIELSVPWILPWLARLALQPGSEAAERGLRFLSRQFPREVYKLLLADKLDAPCRRALAPLVMGATGGWAEECLKRLKDDPDPEVRLAAQRDPSGPTELPLLRVFSFGNLEIFLGDERLEDKDFKSRKIRYLLACLAARRGRPVSDEVLLEAFWPEDSGKAKMANLYAAASYLRAGLKRPNRPDLNFVLRTGGGFQLNPDCPRWHDLDEFEAEEARAQQYRSQGAIDQELGSYRHMVGLYRGPYLEGCSLEWACHMRTRLELAAISSLEFLSEKLLQRGQPALAREMAFRLLDLDPPNPLAHQVVVQAMVAAGRPDEAIKHFQQAARIIQAELGLEPPVELLRAMEEARILLSDPTRQ